jgi:hypothetical protein
MTRIWERLDKNSKVIDRVVMNKTTKVEDAKWLMKNIPGRWRFVEEKQ